MSFRRLLVVVLLASVALLPAASPAAAAESNVGKNPSDTVCATDAVTIVSKVMPDGNLHLRWSPGCGLGWVRFSGSWRVNVANMGSEQAVAHVSMTAWPGYPGPSEGQGGHAHGVLASSYWSKMVDASRGFCGQAQPVSQDGTVLEAVRICT